MSQIFKLKRSAVAGKVPSTSSLQLGEIALNTTDGKGYFKRSSDDSIQSIVTTNSLTTGSINVSGSFLLTGSQYISDGSLDVGGSITLTNNMGVGGDLSVTGSTFINGNMTAVSGTFDYISASGDFVVDDITSDTGYFGYLDVSGDISVTNTASFGYYSGQSSIVTLGTVTSGDVKAILPSGIVSASAQLEPVFLKIVGDGVVSSSVQIDHDQTTNYVAGEHYLQSQIVEVGAVNSGSITSGFGNIDIGSSTFDTTGAVTLGATTIVGNAEVTGSLVSSIGYANHFEPTYTAAYDLGNVRRWRSLNLSNNIYISGSSLVDSAKNITAAVVSASADVVTNGDILLSTNNNGLIGRTTGNGQIDLIKINSSNIVEVGSISLPTKINGSGIIFNGSQIISGSVTISGSLIVLGETIEAQVTELSIEDKIITVASGSVNGAASDGAGIEVDRGSDTNVSMSWDNSNSRFSFNSGLSIEGDLNFATGGRYITIVDNSGAALEVKEGANLYMRFVTTNGSEAIQFGQAASLASTTIGGALTQSGGPVSLSATTVTSLTSTDGVTVSSDTGDASMLDIRRGSVTKGIRFENYNGTNSSFSLTGTENFSTWGTTFLSFGMAGRLGNVGLGTKVPVQKLHVASGSIAIDDGYNIGSTDGNTGMFVNNDSFYIQTNGTTRMTVTGSVGDVGIGTISPESKLHIYTGQLNLGYSALQLQHDTYGSGRYVGTSYSLGNNPPKAAIAFESSGGMSTNGNGQLVFYVDGTDDTSPVSVSDAMMRIHHRGVSIGINSSLSKLYVYEATTNKEGFRVDGVSGGPQIVAYNGTTYSDSYVALRNTLYVTGSSVGIGTLSPRAAFEISNPHVANIYLNDSGGSSNNKLSSLQQNGDQFQIRAYNDSGTGKHIFFVGDNNTGNVGIGTSSPSSSLHIVGGTSGIPGISNDVVKIQGSGGGTALHIGTNDTSGYVWLEGIEEGQSNDRDIVLNTNGGNVGIGTTTPNYKLHISSSGGDGLKIQSHTSDARLAFVPDTSQASNIIFYQDDGSTQDGRIYAPEGSQKLRVEVATTQIIEIDASGLDVTGSLNTNGSFKTAGPTRFGTNTLTADSTYDDVVIETVSNSGLSILTTLAAGDAGIILGGPSNTTGAMFRYNQSSANTVLGTRITGHSLILRSGANVTNLTLSGGSGTELATFARDVTITGALSKGSGTFKINHPNPEKDGFLYHSFVESPTAGDNIYRYQIETIDNYAEIELPEYYQYLNENDQVWISPVEHFGQAYGKVTNDQTKLEIHSNQDGLYNVLLIGTRKDEVAVNNWKGIYGNE